VVSWIVIWGIGDPRIHTNSHETKQRQITLTKIYNVSILALFRVVLCGFVDRYFGIGERHVEASLDAVTAANFRTDYPRAKTQKLKVQRSLTEVAITILDRQTSPLNALITKQEQ